MKGYKHIIQKQSVDVVITPGIDAFVFKDVLSDFCNEKLLPAIEKLFDKRSPKNKTLHADKLVIDVGEISLDNWEEIFVERVIDQLTKCIADVKVDSQDNLRNDEMELFMDGMEKNTLRQISEEESLTQSILYFLENGYLPWNSSIKNLSSLNDAIVKLANDIKTASVLIDKIKHDQRCFERVVYQLSEHAILALIIKAGFETSSVIHLQKFVLDIISKMSAAAGIAIGTASPKYLVYDLLLKGMIEYDEKENTKSDWEDYFDIVIHFVIRKFESGGLERLIPILRESAFENFSERALQYIQIVNSNVRTQTVQDLSANRTEPQPGVLKQRAAKMNLLDDGIFISNAGLIILHPFFSLLFENVGYLFNKEWVSDEHRQRALVLIQYMVTGKEEFPEFDLLLNKILIGFPLNDTLPAEIILSEFEKQEAADVLKSVVKHWAALKNTSIEGLQSSFLTREAKLSSDENGWVLQVEHKTMDILVNRIPWSFSIIKTPWMDRKLHVEWNT
jgi:hypothetical protein